MDLDDVLKNFDITVDQLADIINRAGNRPIEKPIICVEHCSVVSCGITFFSTVTDKRARESKHIPALCPSCKAKDEKSRKTNSMRKWRKSKQTSED